MRTFSSNLEDYLLSGYAIVAVNSYERQRLYNEVVATGNRIGRKVFLWNAAKGWLDTAGKPLQVAAKEPEDVAGSFDSVAEQDAIFILENFTDYCNPQCYPRYDTVIGWFAYMIPFLCNTKRTILLCGPSPFIPNVLKHDITTLDFVLPDEHAIRTMVDSLQGGIESGEGQVSIDQEQIPRLVDACRGMTENEINDRVSLCIRRTRGIVADTVREVMDEKAGVIKNSGLLEYHGIPRVTLADVGGYDVIKRQVAIDKPTFSKEAVAFGLDKPKGLLLVGVPGCGKSLVCRAVAGELGFPLIGMDIGNLMGSLVGQSEEHLRQAIALVEASQPAVLMLDEVEKGIGSGGDLDGGVSKRLFGSLLKWLADKTSDIYVMATANNVQSIPSEFLRTGRFDSLFGFDLPNAQERREIFRLHIQKRRRDPDRCDLPECVKETAGYTGSDIEQVVKLSLKMAFADGKDLHTKYLLSACDAIIPLQKTDPERIKALQEWMKTHVKVANATECDGNIAEPCSRKVVVR